MGVDSLVEVAFDNCVGLTSGQVRYEPISAESFAVLSCGRFLFRYASSVVSANYGGIR